MIAEAIDTAITLGWALIAWIAVLATVGSIVALATIATGVHLTRAAWRRLDGPSWARNPARARILARQRVRAPHGRTDPHHQGPSWNSSSTSA